MNYIPDLYRFLEQVERNNNREWFHRNKEEYDRLRALWLDDLQRLIDLMAEQDPTLRGCTASKAAYRFYRDTRFSQDKSPYKTFFSAIITPYGKKDMRACYYLQMGLDRPDRDIQSGVYGGIWWPDSATLRKLRHAIVDNIEEFTEIADAPAMRREFPGWAGSRLKTIPKGWDKDHPQAEWLKLKDIAKAHYLDEAFFCQDDWVKRTADLFLILKPLNDFINYSIDEE
ncbi:MAG: DUF2461 domain-containing protein [Muribaculaceae bacterium]|nr:DUF2461 domain-containing protein [Muribaculaceae bacterium]